MKRRGWRGMLAAVAAVAMSAVCMHALQQVYGHPAELNRPLVPRGGGGAYLYRFDASGDMYVFTFTLPVEGANSHDVVTVPGDRALEVWVAESGVDHIGRLTVTTTTDYRYERYPLPPGSRPLSLLAAQDAIWFTASQDDYLLESRCYGPQYLNGEWPE